MPLECTVHAEGVGHADGVHNAHDLHCSDEVPHAHLFDAAKLDADRLGAEMHSC